MFVGNLDITTNNTLKNALYKILILLGQTYNKLYNNFCLDKSISNQITSIAKKTQSTDLVTLMLVQRYLIRFIIGFSN